MQLVTPLTEVRGIVRRKLGRGSQGVLGAS